MGEWTGKQIDQLSEKLKEEIKEEGGEAAKELARNIYGKIYLAGLEKVDFEKVFSEKFGPELSEGSLLFLIDRLSPGDHFAQFWAVICQALVNKNFPVKYYFYQGDPRICFDQDGNCATIFDLIERHPQASLLMVGDGNTLMQSSHLAVNPWTSVLENWQKRILLTPKNYYSWNKREDILGKMFYLLPAKLSSLKYIEEVTTVEKFEFSIDSHVDEHVIDYEEDIINEENLTKYFSNTYSKGEEVEKPEPVLDWIQSCAVPRKLDFQLSLELGKASFDRAEGADFNPEVILSVFQLPWFRQGIIPEQIRVLIAKKFEEESAKASEEIRKLLQMKIPQWKQPEGSEAAASLSETKQINEWKIKDPKPDKITRNQVRKELNRIYDQGLQPDGILEVTDGYHNRYSKYFPSRLRPYIFNHGYSGLGLKRWLRNLINSLFAGLILFLVYCIILWLSRPIMGPPEECPPCDYRCIPITKMIGATQSCQKKITLTGTEDKPLLAHLNGVEGDCCLPLEIFGKNTELMIGNDTIGWLAGDSVPDLNEITHGETLRMWIKDRIEFTLSDSATLTCFIRVFDTLRTSIEHLSSDQCNREWMGYDIRFSEDLDICATLQDTFVSDSILRRDTGRISSSGYTSTWFFVPYCLEPDSLIITESDDETWFKYVCGSISDRIIRDTLPCDTVIIEKEKIIPCEIYLNLHCLGDDVETVLKTPPRLLLNGEVLLEGDRFMNRVKLPDKFTRGSTLEFELDSDHYFEGSDSTFRTILEIDRGEFQLEIFPLQGTILQVSGDVILLDASGKNPTDDFLNEISLFHCFKGERREAIRLDGRTFCTDLKEFSFCGSSIRLEWKGEIYATQLIRHHKDIYMCHNKICADFSSIKAQLIASKIQKQCEP
jgi:hypothetical protein